ncbi:MAG: hypothetical protein AAFY56_24060 [Pseudomonadota bacterium]
MIVGDITELSIVKVLDPGVPNKECVAIQVNENLNMGQYGLMLGHYAQNRRAHPYWDHMYWFGDAILNAGDWVFVYTGSGTVNTAKASNDINDVYYLYWGKSSTVFADSIVVPILFRIDAVDVAEPPPNLPQLGNP